MESFIFEHAQLAHWWIFSLLMLAGLNVPISEDLLIIISGVLASTIVPENTWKLFAAIFLGAYLSDWMVYSIGRWLAPHMRRIRWFARVFHEDKIKKIQAYYKKYGTLTLVIGRFIPFGIRNALFVTAGLGKMRLLKFLIIDGVACLLSNTALFTLTYFCGRHYTYIFKFIHIIVFVCFAIALGGYLLYKKRRKNAERI